MNLTYLRAGNDWVALSPENDVVGVLKSIGDSWKVEKPIAFKKAFVDVKRMADIDERIKQSRLKRSELRRNKKKPIIISK